MTYIQKLPRHPRPKTRHNKSMPIEELPNDALLMLVAGERRMGTNLDSARRLMEFACKLDTLARLAPAVIATQLGIRASKAERLHAAFELGRRRWAVNDCRPRIDSPDAVVAWARPRLLTLDHEEVWLLSLDGRNDVCSSRRVAQGGQHGCALTAKDILRPALRDGASAIIVVHNHPSGDPTPSDADLKMTAELDLACAAVGVPLLDHVVIATDGAVSLLELGVVRGE